VTIAGLSLARYQPCLLEDAVTDAQGKTTASVENTGGMNKWTLFSIIVVVFTVLDQITKIWVVRNVKYRVEEIQIIDGFLSIVHAQNTGAAFGFLAGAEYAQLFFGVFTLIAVGVLAQMMRQLEPNDTLQIWAVGLISSGTVGNAIDRMDKQSVTDFVRVYTENPSLKAWLIGSVGTNEWPSFNVADAAIVVGLGLFLIDYLFFQKEEEELEASPPSAPLIDEESSGG
jgi:signal peptidase II